MSTKRLMAMLVNVAAIMIPTAALYIRYGSGRVDSNDSGYLLALCGAMLASFLAGTLASRLLRSSADSFYAIFQSMTRAFQAESESARSRAASRAA